MGMSPTGGEHLGRFYGLIRKFSATHKSFCGTKRTILEEHEKDNSSTIVPTATIEPQYSYN